MKLTPSQKGMIKMLYQGCSYKQVAATLNVTLGTVKSTLFRAYRSLGVRNKDQAMEVWRNHVMKEVSKKI